MPPGPQSAHWEYAGKGQVCFPHGVPGSGPCHWTPLRIARSGLWPPAVQILETQDGLYNADPVTSITDS